MFIENIFVKVFDQKTDTYNDENEDHYDFLDHNSGEYFTCEYYAGNSINPIDDLYVPTNSSNVTSPENLEYIFKYFVNRRLESNLSTDDYKDTPDADNKSAYYLIDSVSERVLGVANCENKTINNVTFAKDLSLSKNYVFYVVSKTYYEKNMLK